MGEKQGEHVNWTDQVSKDYNLDEEIKTNPGFGKTLPKSLFKGDTYSNFLNTAKNAGYLPNWIRLQKEIRDELAKVMDLSEQKQSGTSLSRLLEEINTKIKQYNRECPANMQRGMVTFESIEKQYEFWK